RRGAARRAVLLRHRRASVRRGADPRRGAAGRQRAGDAAPAAWARSGLVRSSERGSPMTAVLPIVLSALVAGGAAQAAGPAVPLQRFLLVVGANAGGGDRAKLQYAISDAARLYRVHREVGAGVAAH